MSLVLGKSSISFLSVISWYNLLTVLHIIIFLLLLLFFLTIDILEEPKTAADTIMPMTPASTIPIAPTPMDLGTFLSPVPFLIFIIGFTPLLCLSLVNSCSISYFFPGPTPVEVAPSFQFEVGSNFAIVPDPASEATTFFIRFNQPETNGLNPSNFWGAGTPYVNFHGFQVLGECIFHLEVVYNSYGDFMQGVSFWLIHE